MVNRFIKDSFIMVKFFLGVAYNKLRVTERVCNISHYMNKLLVVTTKAHVKGVCAFKNISRPVSFIICIYLSCYVNTMLFIYIIMFPLMSKKGFDSFSHALFNLGVIDEIRDVYLSHCKTLLVCNSYSIDFPITRKKLLFIFISKRLFLSSMFFAINLNSKVIKRYIKINITPLPFAVIEALFSLMVNMCFVEQFFKMRLGFTIFIKEFVFPLYKLRANAFESFNLFFTEIFCVKFKIHNQEPFLKQITLIICMDIPTLPPQLNIGQRFGEFPFRWCLLKINIYDKYIIISRKPQPIIPCIEECLPAPVSDRLLASRLSPSSLVGGTLRGLAPEGRIYQSEQFYISANTTEEDCTDLTSYGMGIKIPCKSHWWRAGLYAGYRTTLFQKVFIRYPFILPSPYALPVMIAPQRYNKNLYINLKVFVCKLCIVKIIHNLPCNYVYKFLTKIFYNTKYCRKSAAIGLSNLHQVTDYQPLKYVHLQFPVLKVVGLNPTGVTNLQVIENQLITNISSRYFEHPP